MASVIETFLREAHGHIKALELLVSVLERGAEDESHERRLCNDCVREGGDARRILKLAKDETQALLDHAQQDQYDDERKREKKRLRKAYRKFQELDRFASERQALVSADVIVPVDKKKNWGNAEYRNEALGLTDATTEALQAGLNTVNDTQKVATATARAVVKQGVQIHTINDDVVDLDASLNRSDKLIVELLKRLWADKCIKCLACTVFCLIAIIVIYNALNPGQTDFNVPEETRPPSPSQVSSAASSFALRALAHGYQLAHVPQVGPQRQQ